MLLDSMNIRAGLQTNIPQRKIVHFLFVHTFPLPALCSIIRTL